MVAEDSDTSLTEIQAELKLLTFPVTVNGNTLTFPEEFFDEDLVFTKVK
jgi:hypothetical protein